MKKGGEGGPVFVNQESEKDSCPEEHRDEGSLYPRIKGHLNFQFQFSSFCIRRVISIRHRADFFFHFRDVHHHDGVPRAAVQEAAVGAFAEAFLAPEALEGINLDAPERRIVLVRHPEHAVFHWTVLHARRRPRATRAALGNYSAFLRLLLARGDDSLRARLKFLLVRHHPWRLHNVRCISHFQRFYPDCQVFVSVVFAPFATVPRLLQCPCNPVRLPTCSQKLSTNISCPRSSPDLRCASISSGASPSTPATPPITRSLPATGSITVSMVFTPTDNFCHRMRAPLAIRRSSPGFIFWRAPAEKRSCSHKLSSILSRAFSPQASPRAWRPAPRIVLVVASQPPPFG